MCFIQQLSFCSKGKERIFQHMENKVEKGGYMEEATMNFEQAKKWVEQANESAGQMGLDGIRELMKALENPQDQLRMIHVGGTNGKGSICSYIAYILAAAGYRVGRYISPSVREYRECIQTLEYKNGIPQVEYISETDYVRLVEKNRQVYKCMAEKNAILPSTFELETAISFCYFLEKKCDFVLLEVGMGGKRDATNIISSSECTVFASISMDHMNILGNTLEEITKEKAGILKPNGTVVTYDYDWMAKAEDKVDVITPILKEMAQTQANAITSADFNKITSEKHTLHGITFTYGEYTGLETSLLGDNQTKNAAVAIEVIKQLQGKGYNVQRQHVYKGLKDTKWEGRFQVVWQNPYYIVDGAHNVDAAKSLKKSISLYLKDKKILFITGILADKEYEKIMELLAPCAKKIITVTPDNPRALPAKKLKNVALQYCSCVESRNTVYDALMLAQQEEQNYDAVLIFGSLYSLHLFYDYLEQRKSGAVPHN